jgi:hypothetical protein
MIRDSQYRASGLRSGLFQLGEVGITPYACKILANAGMDARPLLGRHIAGDWGEVDARLERRNNKACQNFALVESRYRVMGRLLSIVTDGQRTTTTISASVEMSDITVTGEGRRRGIAQLTVEPAGGSPGTPTAALQ